MYVSDAIAELAAGGVVTRSHSRETIAGVEDVIPILQTDAAVDAELQQLDAVDVALDEVGVDRLGVAAVGVEGVAAALLRFAADISIERPVIRVDLPLFEG